MNRKAIDSKTVILLTVILTISTATFTMLPSAAADVYASGVTNYPWPLGGHDLNRTSYTAAPAPHTNATSWKFATGGSVRSGAAVVDGIVYIGSDDNKLYALDMETGEELWSYTTGGDARSTPAVADGKVFFGSRDGTMYCLTTAGVFEWSFAAGTEVRSAPAVADGKVFFGSRPLTSGTDPDVWCFTTAGVQVWNYTTGDRVDGGVAVVPAADVVFVGSWINKLYALNMTTGEKLWDYDVGSDIVRDPVVADGLVFAASKAGRQVYALNMSTGVLVMNYSVTGDIRGGLAVAEGKLYVAGTSNGVMFAFDIATGATLWTHSTMIGSWYGIPAVADGLVFVIAMDSYVYALDMDDGTVVWKYKTGASSDEAYGAVADGFLFIGSGDNNVYAFRTLPRLFVDPPSIIDVYDISESFTIEVKVEYITDLWSYAIGLKWDPAVLECTGVTYVDTLLPDTAEYPGDYMNMPGTYSNTFGNFTKSYGRTLTWQNTKGVNGSGTLLNVTFQVKDYGETWISFMQSPATGLGDSNFQPISTDVQNCWFKLSLPDTTDPTIAGVVQSPAADEVYPDEAVNVTAIDVTDNVAVDKVLLKYSTDNVTFINVTMTWVVGTNNYTGQIPGQAAGTYVTYKIFTNDTSGNWIETSVYAYRVNVPPDTTAPTITDVVQSPAADEVYPDEVVNVTAINVTDNVEVHVVLLMYSTDNVTFTSVPMSRVGETNNYTGQIPGLAAGTYVTYKIFANDTSGNWIETDPDVVPGKYRVIPEFPTWTSILLILIVFTFAIAIYKRRLIKTPIH